MKLFITEYVIKINYTILYKLLDNYIFGSCHHNRANPAYETVHHHIHAILEDGRRSSVWRLRLSFRFWVQLFDDADVTSDQFSLSVVGKLMNTLAPIVSRSQLFQGQSRTLLSSHTLQLSDEKQFESVAISVIAGWRQRPLTICDVSQRNYFTPTEHHIGSAVYTRDDRDSVLPRSSL